MRRGSRTVPPSTALQPHFKFVQRLLRQSDPEAQLFPKAHFGHLPPPQSTSVSSPFFT